MSLIDGLQNDTITLNRANGGYDDNEQPIKTTIVINCRKEDRNDRVLDFRGREVMSEMFVMTTEVVTVEDTVTENSITYPILRVSEAKELDGTFSHNEVYVGRISGR